MLRHVQAVALFPLFFSAIFPFSRVFLHSFEIYFTPPACETVGDYTIALNVSRALRNVSKIYRQEGNMYK